MTRPYAEVIGDPIAHSKSPLIHNFWLARLGIDAEYRACRVLPDELADYFARRRGDAEWRGCNVTIPHKQAVAALIAFGDGKEAALGAANTIVPSSDRQLRAFNTDVVGVREALEGAVRVGAWVVVIGAGGAARAAFRALEAKRAGEVLVMGRNAEKAVESTRQFDIFGVGVPMEDADSISDADLLINASPLGMIGQPPMPEAIVDAVAMMADASAVFDMVYTPLETPLLAAARLHGKRAIDGLTMLVGQAAAAFEFFFGQPAPREHDAELRALLTA